MFIVTSFTLHTEPTHFQSYLGQHIHLAPSVKYFHTCNTDRLFCHILHSILKYLNLLNEFIFVFVNALCAIKQKSPDLGRGLLGTRLPSRRWAAGKRTQLHLPPIPPPPRLALLLESHLLPLSTEKLSSLKLVPGAKRVEDHYYKELWALTYQNIYNSFTTLWNHFRYT